MQDRLMKITYDDEKTFLYLRPLQAEDASLINAAVHDSLEHLLPFMDWAHFKQTESSQRNRILNSIEKFKIGTEYDFILLDRAGEFLGLVSLTPSITLNKKSFGIGYWTSARHCNKGVATLGTQILIIFAFDILGCDRIEIGCNKANKASQKVIANCGFVYEGEIRNYFSQASEEMLRNKYVAERDFLLYSLTKNDSIPWYQTRKKFIRLSF